jgi:hypothetical protein
MKLHFLKHVFFGLAIVAIFSAVVMLLWNALVPSIFGLTVITFWQSLGLLALVRLLFGCGFGGKNAMAGRWGHGGGFGKNPMREKWMNMTPEERKEFVKHRHFDPRCRKEHQHGFEGAYNFDCREREDFSNDKKEDFRG